MFSRSSGESEADAEHARLGGGEGGEEGELIPVAGPAALDRDRRHQRELHVDGRAGRGAVIGAARLQRRALEPAEGGA